MIKKIFKKFFLFPLGIRRFLIVGILFFPFIIAVLSGANRDEDIFLGGIILGIPIYIILVLISAWIYEGFLIEKDKK